MLLKAQYQTQIVERHTFKQNPHTAKAFSSQEHIYKKFEPHGKLTFFWVQVDKPNLTFKKKANFGNFVLTKIILKHNIKLNAPIICIDPACCVSWRCPHTIYIAITFKIIELSLVQRYETHIEAKS